MPHPGSHIGTLIKPHGFRGEMVIKGEKHFLNNLKEGIALFLDISGQRIPFFIEDFSPDVSEEKGIVKLEFVDSEIQARKYSGCDVYLEEKYLSSGTSRKSYPEYIGLSVIDRSSKKQYQVVDYFDNPGNPVLVLRHGREEVLVPANADYFIKGQIDGDVLSIEFPEGLTD